MRFQVETDGQTEAHLRFSKKLAAILVTGVVLLVAVICGTSFWMSNKFNALARANAEQMTQGGFAALEETLRKVTRDYSHWNEAYDGIRNRDIQWVYSNIGVGVTESGTADLVVIVEPGAKRQYGWNTESGEEPQTDLLPPEVIASALRLVEPMPADDVVPVTFYANVGGMLWLIGASRVLPSDGVAPGTADADIPRQILGFRIDSHLVTTIGVQHMVNGMSVGTTPLKGSDNLALKGADGQAVGYIHWVRPTPGGRILAQIGPPLGLTLALLAVAAALASAHVVRSAQRLERAVEANRRKSEFLANASHELRTPMNGVIGIAQLLERSGLDERQQDLLKVLATSAIAQMNLIEDLLDISRIDSGRLTIAKVPFQPGHTVTEVLGIVTPEATCKGLELRADLDGCGTIEVLGDPDAFRRIVTNLAGNAVKFTQQGHVAVSLTASAEQDPVHLTLVVEDTGPGIDPADQPRIFERFVRAQGAATKTAGGTGLGLAITKSLVEFMGGEIGLASKPGEGAVFTVTLTLDIAEAAEHGRDAA